MRLNEQSTEWEETEREPKKRKEKEKSANHSAHKQSVGECGERRAPLILATPLDRKNNPAVGGTGAETLQCASVQHG